MNVFWFSLITIKYKFGLSVCLPVWLYPINVKTAEPIGPNFFVGPQGRFMNDKNFKNVF